MDKEGLTLEQIKEIYVGKINDTYTLNLAVSMLENYDELLKKYEEKDKEIERLNNIINELEKHLLDYLEEWGECKEDDEFVSGRCLMARDVIHDIYELKEGRK